jgi:DNA-binding NtrC family response regulator
VEVSVRIIAATNRDLQKAVNDGGFRSDLYYRINTICIALPPLRERVVDIPLLANHFLKQFGGSNPPRLTEEAIHALEGYRWPGNIRELRNVIERAVLLANGGVIHAHDLPLTSNIIGSGTVAGGNGQKASLSDLERQHIESVLQQTNWHQGKAATMLGISSKTLYRKIREYGFERPKGV